MSADITTTAAAEGETAATEGAPNVHAVESSPNVMMAGTHNCARCASYVQELSIATERYDALTVAMKQQENDAIVSKALADQRCFPARQSLKLKCSRFKELYSSKI